MIAKIDTFQKILLDHEDLASSKIYVSCKNDLEQSFLAHLSRRLISELIVYPCSGVRPSSVRPSVVHNFKDLLL